MNPVSEDYVDASRALFENMIRQGRDSAVFIELLGEIDSQLPLEELLRHATPRSNSYVNPSVDKLWSGWALALMTLPLIFAIQGPQPFTD